MTLKDTMEARFDPSDTDKSMQLAYATFRLLSVFAWLMPAYSPVNPVIREMRVELVKAAKLLGLPADTEEEISTLFQELKKELNES